MNQCDWCLAELPLENWMHIDAAPGGKFLCTKSLYEDQHDELKEAERKMRQAIADYTMLFNKTPVVDMYDFRMRANQILDSEWHEVTIQFYWKRNHEV